MPAPAAGVTPTGSVSTATRERILDQSVDPQARGARPCRGSWRSSEWSDGGAGRTWGAWSPSFRRAGKRARVSMRRPRRRSRSVRPSRRPRASSRSRRARGRRSGRARSASDRASAGRAAPPCGRRRRSRSRRTSRRARAPPARATRERKTDRSSPLIAAVPPWPLCHLSVRTRVRVPSLVEGNRTDHPFEGTAAPGRPRLSR